MVRAECFVSVVAPLHDDSDIVSSLVTDLADVLRRSYESYEIVLVDDGSSDGTVAAVTALLGHQPHVRLICLSRSFGQETAISAGLDSAIGDYAVVLLPDMDPPELIPQMVEQARAGAAVVFGIRRQRAREPFLLRLGARFFYWYAARVLKLGLPADSTHFRVLNRQVVNAMMRITGRGRYLRTMSHYVGFANQSFLYDPIQRRSPPRSKGLIEACELAVDIIVSNTSQPLRLVSRLAVALGAINLLYLGYVAAAYLFSLPLVEGDVTPSLHGAVMFIFLFLILAIGCEYLGRLISDSRGQPLYYVTGEVTSSATVLDQDRRNVVSDSADA